MKRINTFVSTALVASTLIFTACSDAPAGDKTTVTGQQQVADANGARFAIDTAASSLKFTGNGVGKNHPGTFKLSNGSIALDGNVITGGQFTINIQSLEVDEKGDMFQNKLKPHLLNADFFDAQKFPTATFQITKVVPYTATGADSSVVAGANHLISGNLTLKGVTKNVTFPAKIEATDNTLAAAANFNINRTDWNMSYGNDKSLGDKFISETVNIQLNLKAGKK